MKDAWIVAVAVAAGAYVGYLLARRGGGQAQGGRPSQGAPSDRICPQVAVTCADGSFAPTPCHCEGRGGVKHLGVIA